MYVRPKLTFVSFFYVFFLNLSLDQNREKGDLGQKQRHKCDSNTPKDPLRNSAGVKHLKRNIDLFKDGYKNLSTVLRGREFCKVLHM